MGTFQLSTNYVNRNCYNDILFFGLRGDSNVGSQKGRGRAARPVGARAIFAIARRLIYVIFFSSCEMSRAKEQHDEFYIAFLCQHWWPESGEAQACPTTKAPGQRLNIRCNITTHSIFVAYTHVYLFTRRPPCVSSPPRPEIELQIGHFSGPCEIPAFNILGAH